MPSTTAAGTGLAISAASPTGQTSAAYGSLSYVEISNVEQIGGFGASTEVVSFQPLKGPLQKHKGPTNYGSLTPTLALDDADAGQTLLAAASAPTNNALYAFRVTKPDGSLRFFQARVFGMPETIGAANSMITAAPVIEINTPIVKVGAGGTTAPGLYAAEMFYMGDSRVASMYNDGTKNNKNAGNHFVAANTQMGQRMTFVGNTGVAGQRSDEYSSSTSTMTASSAPTVVVFGVVNDIAQGKTAAEAWTSVKGIIDAAIAAGKRVIAHTEPGAEGFSAMQRGHRNSFNASLTAYAAANSTKLEVFDFASAALTNPGSADAITFKSGYSYDGTHLTNFGAHAVGEAFAAWAATRIDGTPAVLANMQTNNLVTNKQFATATGGSVQSGLTGTAPASWSAVKTGTAAGAVSVSAGPTGTGNEVVIAATGAAAGDRVQLSQQITTGIVLNDRLRFLVEVAVDAGSSNLRSIRAYVSYYFNGLAIQYQKFDMQPIAAHLNAGTGAYLDMLSPDIGAVMMSGATSFDRVDVTIAAEFSGSGSATFRIRQPTLLKV